MAAPSRYPRTQPSPMPKQALLGPAHNRLHVSLLQAGQSDTSFGMAGAAAADGTPLSFQGPLTELQA